MHVVLLGGDAEVAPAANGPRDHGVADTYRTYLGVALAEPVVRAVVAFGLSDRYTWLQEDYPRDDGAPRRPLVYDDQMQPKPAYDAVSCQLGQAAPRAPIWSLAR